jgi:3-deoxy-D-manno-octulosonic-acid transferase
LNAPAKRLPLGLMAWRALSLAAQPFAPLLLSQRAARGKEDRARMKERLGIAGRPRPDGKLVWVHGASVGESLAALPLIERLQAQMPGTSVLVTSGTVTSARMMQARLPQGAIHQFVPLDTPRAVSRFLDHWKPDAGLFVESDLWPNLILAAAARSIPLALVNARISARSAAGWNRARGTVKRLLAAFDAVLAQDEEIAARFRALGARNVTIAGSLKADAPPLACDETALAALQSQIGARPVLLAAQTHSGEDETVLPAHDMLRARFPDLLTIIVPRHLERAADIEMLCGARAARRRSLGQAISEQTQVYIADTLGELGLFYRLAPFAFVGGTLVPMGGHNPLEPAVLNRAVLAGPHRASAVTAYQAILGAQGFGSVTSSGDIAREAARLFGDVHGTQAAGAAAARGAATLAGAVARTLAVLQALLSDRAGLRDHAHA